MLRLAVILASAAMAGLCAELALRLAVNPGDYLYATLSQDPIMGFRIMPNTTGHDGLGYRNRAVPERANIVAIGDSMTYGVSTVRDGSWPHQLGELLHEPVYNMGLGGYGPLQYLYLAQHEAKALKPRLLLVAFYFGNDLTDAYNSAHQRPYWYSWREGNPDAAALALTEYNRAAGIEPKKRFAALRDWLSRHSVLYCMAQVTILPRIAMWEQDRMALQVEPDRQVTWVDPSQHSVRTIFTPALRFSTLDTRDPSVLEGLRITKRAFAALRDVADADRTRLLVVLLPTKERAYCRYLQDTGERMSKTMVELCGGEQRIKEDLEQFFSASGIAYVDATVALEEQVRNHIQLYPPGSDGHPQAAGYGVIARAVYEAMGGDHPDK